MLYLVSLFEKDMARKLLTSIVFLAVVSIATITRSAQLQNSASVDASTLSRVCEFSCTNVNLYSGKDFYGKFYEEYALISFVTLEDCRAFRCRREVLLDDALPENYTVLHNALANPDEYNRQRLVNRADVPGWLKEGLILPFYDRFQGPESVILCDHLDDRGFFDSSHILYNLGERKMVSYKEGCNIIADRLPFLQAAHFYWAFYGYTSFGSSHMYTSFASQEDLFPNAFADRLQRMTSLLGAYCFPFTVLILLFALYVVRGSLHISDSHVYHYHKALTMVDLLMALFLFLKETFFIRYLLKPFCMAAPEVFARIATQPLLSDEELPSLVVYLPILTLACFASTIQAILAADRMCACYFPIVYQRMANKTVVVRLILAASALTLGALCAEVYKDQTIECLLKAANDTDVCQEGFLLVNAEFGGGQVARLALLILTFLAQVVCCIAVFVKMLVRQLNPVHKQQNASVNKKLVPFYLLFGTCVLSLFGTAIELLFLLSSSELFNTAASGFMSLSMRLRLTGFCQRFRVSVTSAGNSCGLFVHLLVSGHCRAAARQGLKSGSRILKAACVRVSAPFKMIVRLAVRLGCRQCVKNAAVGIAVPPIPMHNVTVSSD